MYKSLLYVIREKEEALFYYKTAAVSLYNLQKRVRPIVSPLCKKQIICRALGMLLGLYAY